ncbi:hypothetical protein [Nesterenkonia populi]|uniref:hypothetical protein n=1 Tax=Nesterenkonia populi TaxID=1591087 RepID=UPI0011BF2466|nr:hypothetical protein [Nesterenkonia populi]
MLSTLVANFAAAAQENPYAPMQEWVESLHGLVQWLMVMVVSAVPFLEAYGGAFLGALGGMPLWLLLPSAVIGNMLVLFGLVYMAQWIRGQAVGEPAPEEELSKKKQRVKRIFDRFGVPAVALLGPFALPSQFTAPLMVGFGASRNAVMLWMLISVILWAVLGWALGAGIVSLVS